MKGILKNLLLAGLLALMVFGAFSSLSATETRVTSMGGVGFYVRDNSNIFFFPGTLLRYSGQVVGELRNKNDDLSYTIGIHYPINNNSVAGFYLNRPFGTMIPDGIVQQVELDQTTDFMYATGMSQFDLGFRLSLAMDSYKQDTTEKESAHYFGVSAGASADNLDLGVQFELPGISRTFQDTFENKWSGTGLGANFRMFMGEKTQLVPVVNFGMASASSEMGIAPDTDDVDFSRMTLGLGVGVNHHIDDNNMLVLALEVLGINKNSQDTTGIAKSTTSITTMPGLYMGLESKIKTWLTGRMGAARVFQSQKDTHEPDGGNKTETSSKSSQYNVSFGVGIHFSNFMLDAAINEGILFDGPNFISGGTNPIANRLSLTYQF